MSDCGCGHPASLHGRSGCYHYDESGSFVSYCACPLRPEQVRLIDAEAQLAEFRAALARARVLLDKFSQGEPVSLDGVVSVLSECGELLAREI